jgi:hypothetical protein
MGMLKDEERALAYLNAALDEQDPRVFLRNDLPRPCTIPNASSADAATSTGCSAHANRFRRENDRGRGFRGRRLHRGGRAEAQGRMGERGRKPLGAVKVHSTSMHSTSAPKS